jgi:hypothetical protein
MRGKFSRSVALAVLCSLGGMLAWSAAAGDQAPADPQKLEAALAPTVKLLQLMDTDRNGKVSKQEFLHFMESEFDFADRNHDGELDPKELQHLVQRLHRPVEGPGR